VIVTTPDQLSPRITRGPYGRGALDELTPFSYSNRSWPVGPARERLRRGPRHDGVHGVVGPGGSGGRRTPRRRVDTGRLSETRWFTRGGRAPWAKRGGAPRPLVRNRSRRGIPAASAPAAAARLPPTDIGSVRAPLGPNVVHGRTGEEDGCSASPAPGTYPGVSQPAGALCRSRTARPTSRQRVRRRSNRSRSFREESGSPSASRHGRRTVGRPP
jgi:hypothetical protein